MAALLGSCGAFEIRAPRGCDHVLAKSEYEHAHWGIHVEDLVTGEILVGMNSERLFAPASNTKLFSVAAALEEFGAEHTFETRIHRQGDLSTTGVLRGELILRPTGDLTLGGRDDGKGGIAFGNSDHIYANSNPNTELTDPSPVAGLENLAAQVKAAGIKAIRDLIIDNRLFTPTSSTGSGPSSVTPIVVNDNLVDFIIQPTTRGKPARVDYRPTSASYVVESHVQTIGRGSYSVRIQSPRPGHFVLTGTIPHRHPRQIEVHEVHDPAANARQLLIEALRRAGVAVGASQTEFNPDHLLPRSCEGLPVVAKLVTAPFSEEVKLILKVSHNLHASTLPVLIAVRHGQKDLNAGLALQGKLLRKIGVDVDDISFGGAAGGARADMTTPRVTVQLLRLIASRPYYKAFRRALPILGVDGTLFQIATDSPARGKVQAKTGTYYVYNAMNKRRLLTSKALGGYMTAKSGRHLAFSIVVNNVHLNDHVSTSTIGQDLGAISAAIQQAY
jgi:D-alanyl-D-alanine carboxypeptidase/D-alanyl-D-alanine-endopeptidase (penicillin-binding protein 4)